MRRLHAHLPPDITDNLTRAQGVLHVDDVARTCGYGTTNALRIALRKNTNTKPTSAKANPKG